MDFMPLRRYRYLLPLVLAFRCASVTFASPWADLPAGQLATDSTKQCKFPPHWFGHWYQNEQAPIRIYDGGFDMRGKCVEQSGNQYLFHWQSKGKECRRCLIIFEQHRNILQFKETKCSSESTLKEVCSQFFGDTPVITLFRANPQPEPCPFRGPFNFTYENYRGSCKTRISTGDFCVSNSKLKLNYQSCPETYLSESKVEFIQCIAQWSGDQYKFFAGKLLGKSSFSDADNFRCFTYELNPRGGTVSISADASCQELMDIDTAAVRLEFLNELYPTPQCSFMHWLITKHNEKNRVRLWESLHSAETYRFYRHELVVYDSNTRSNSSISTCIQADSFGVMSQFVLYTVNDCDHGYTCMKIYKRTPYVIEILQGTMATAPYLACTKDYFDESLVAIETFLDSAGPVQKCPHKGRYSVKGCNENDSSISVGCDSEQQLVIDIKCPHSHTDSYTCHGHWTDGEWNYLVLKDTVTGQRSCAVYTRHNDYIHNISHIGKHVCHLTILPTDGEHQYFSLQSDICNSGKEQSNSNDRPHGRFAFVLIFTGISAVRWRF